MYMGLDFKFIEEKERKVDKLGHQLSMAWSSSLITTNTSPNLTIVTHEHIIGTHYLRDEHLVMFLHEEHLYLQVVEERGLATQEVGEDIIDGP